MCVRYKRFFSEHPDLVINIENMFNLSAIISMAKRKNDLNKKTYIKAV